MFYVSIQYEHQVQTHARETGQCWTSASKAVLLVVSRPYCQPILTPKTQKQKAKGRFRETSTLVTKTQGVTAPPTNQKTIEFDL